MSIRNKTIIFVKKTMGEFVIIKFIKNQQGKEMPVIIIDTHNEVLEFETFEEAEKMRDLMEANSDSGYRYEVKKI